MNNYQDIWSRFHDKPVTESDPVPCNNAWLYTAYAVKAGLPVDREKLEDCAWECFDDGPVPHYLRSPSKVNPPFSRDELLGVAYLQLPDLYYGITKHWSFSPYHLPKFSLIKLVKQLWELRPRKVYGFYPYFETPDRNYFWQNNLDQIYLFAFSVPVVDRYFILKKWDKFQFYNPIHLLYAGIAQIDKLGQPSGLRFLKYGGEKNKAAMIEEFPTDHPIVLKVKNV